MLTRADLTDPDTVVERAERNLAGYGPVAPLLDDSSSAHRKLDASEGLQDAQLDDWARLHIAHSDVGCGGT